MALFQEIGLAVGYPVVRVIDLAGARAPQPHRGNTFEFTRDPAAEEKIYDVVACI